MKGIVIGTVAVFATAAVWASSADDIKAVSALDTRYQAAVKANDPDTMAKILDADFVLVIGNGLAFDTRELLRSARDKDAIYTHQEEEPGTQTVRVWGDTAVVTAKLWLAGTRGGKPFDRKLWFSDTYRRTPEGGRYVFGQASLALDAK